MPFMQTVKRLTKEDMPPEQPFKPYILFYIEHYRTEPKASTFAAMAIVAAKAWKAMDDAGRQVYHDRYAELRVDYSKRLQEYFDKTDRETLKRVKLKLKASHRSVPRDAKRPLLPGSPWTVFLQEQTKTIGPAPPGVRGVLHNTKILAERWRALTPEERAPYHERYKQLLEEYYSKTNRSPPIRAATRIASE
ncbi:uncharacterized protein C8Q71DRAFT_576826 [Rhodofomes roseus]|uniref:HMG box domain-containing protein n=1 Tax=Rhodofomes roseus TaxID=34475 RepID=A0ABQ8KJ81_9APHY|nr:uncharacterized protein C8Q71DRAFT_576826 [Rhodofomes roseus]KAH9838070.1 hypothetical protein C8Q71DRAFT_576826 [Rhodofomes roseus]